MERFDIFNARLNQPPQPVEATEPPEPATKPEPEPATNGHHDSSASMADATPVKRSPESDEISDMVNGSPPKKKRKPEMDADALYAAKLQAEEDKLARATRGGSSRKSGPVKKKKTPKKKTSARIKASDDSDMDDSESGEKKPPKTTGFHVSATLSLSSFASLTSRRNQCYFLHHCQPCSGARLRYVNQALAQFTAD